MICRFSLSSSSLRAHSVRSQHVGSEHWNPLTGINALFFLLKTCCGGFCILLGVAGVSTMANAGISEVRELMSKGGLTRVVAGFMYLVALFLCLASIIVLIACMWGIISAFIRFQPRRLNVCLVASASVAAVAAEGAALFVGYVEGPPLQAMLLPWVSEVRWIEIITVAVVGSLFIASSCPVAKELVLSSSLCLPRRSTAVVGANQPLLQA